MDSQELITEVPGTVMCIREGGVHCEVELPTQMVTVCLPHVAFGPGQAKAGYNFWLSVNQGEPVIRHRLFVRTAEHDAEIKRLEDLIDSLSD